MTRLRRFNTAYHGADVMMIITITLSRMWMFVKYSEGTWKSEKAIKMRMKKINMGCKITFIKIFPSSSLHSRFRLPMS